MKRKSAQDRGDRVRASIVKSWRTIDESQVAEEHRPQFSVLVMAVTVLVKEHSLEDVLAVARMRKQQFFQRLSSAPKPHEDAAEINGSRTSVSSLSPRSRRRSCVPSEDTLGVPQVVYLDNALRHYAQRTFLI